ncbi:hypothetical protein ZIOFF_011277 [Zingiber officinale]|uniref:DNA/RNA-binding protein Alba-like domain-containing protein n=1 Tax=Zingiber officinale TaxID=94328 RepID=A0A8J5LSN0_ZINOF|nr:hypothetical protein ZIOFF_011277 [Zingiber officinale]
MDRYQKVEKPRPESAAISENEIRITSQGLIRNYVNYASSLLQERNLKVIVLKAMGMAISKAVAATEIIKKWNPHLHQDVSISSVSITDVWEPIEEGLVPLETKRLVSVISITLSIIEPKKKTPGYQAPAQVEQPKRQQKSQQLQQPQQQQQQHRQTLGQLNQDSYGRERSRGSVRGRGWARGGYGGYNNDQGGYYGYRNNQGGYNGGGYNGGGYNGFSYNQVIHAIMNSICTSICLFRWIVFTTKMVDGTQTGAEVVGQVEVGIPVVQVQSMEEDLEVDQVVVEGVAMSMAAAEVMFVGEDG